VHQVDQNREQKQQRWSERGGREREGKQRRGGADEEESGVGMRRRGGQKKEGGRKGMGRRQKRKRRNRKLTTSLCGKRTRFEGMNERGTVRYQGCVKLTRCDQSHRSYTI
jgi:hypothetical protein